MPLLHDIQTAQRVLVRILQSRQNRRAVESQEHLHPLPEPSSIEIAVYFADTTVNMYQIRQWFAPLAEIASKWPVTIISRSPGTALALWEESPVPTLYLRKISDLEEFVQTQQLKIVFYVNQNAKNFQMFRYGRVWHVFINHGESDKMYMTTNQFKAYDYSLVAGEAAIERLQHKLWDFDLGKKVITIGRPQADHFTGELPYIPDERTVVLYAPTWEGDREAAAYGSIATHGVQLVSALLATGKHRVIYRPHPRSGVLDPGYKSANEAIIAAIVRANRADPTAQHIVDESTELGWQLVDPDVAITDISAMVYDRLATGKPVIVTRPSSTLAEVDDSGFLGACQWLTSEEAAEVVAIVERVQFDEAARVSLAFWAERHFGDTSPGEATRRFHKAIEQLIAKWHKHEKIHARDPQGSDADPFAADEDEESTTIE